MVEKKVTYQGVDIFSRAGVLKLRENCDIVYKYFLWVTFIGTTRLAQHVRYCGATDRMIEMV